MHETRKEKSLEPAGYSLKERLVRIMEWAKVKCGLHTHDTSEVFFYEREIWWAKIGENVGSEQNGKDARFVRPVLVLKKFHAGLLLVVPLTTKEKRGSYYFAMSEVPGAPKAMAVLSQIRTISAKRLENKLRTISRKEFGDIRQAVRKMI